MIKRHWSMRLVVVCCICATGGLLGTGPAGRAATVRSARTGQHAAQVAGVAASGELPLAFEPTWGQSGPQVRFLARGRGYTVLLSATGMMLTRDAGWTSPVPAPQALFAPVAVPRFNPAGAMAVPHLWSNALGLVFLGANPLARLAGANPLPGTVNYMLGNDPRHWHIGIPTYASVIYRDVYPGIDQIVSSRAGRVVYQFVVHPGADPTRIRLRMRSAPSLPAGADARALLGSGTVLTSLGPPVHQAGPGPSVLIAPARSNIDRRWQDTLTMPPADRQGEPIAGPLLSYATYLEGPDMPVYGPLAVDPAGEVSLLPDFGPPGKPTARLGSRQGHILIVKLNAAGTAVLSTTYVGGNGPDLPAGIAMDHAGDTYITGITFSTNFPITSGAFVSTRHGPEPLGFVAVLNPSGTALIYSTYLSTAGPSAGMAIAVDSQANAYVAAQMNPVDRGRQGLVLKLTATGAASYQLQLPAAADAIAVDGTGHAYVSGLAPDGDVFRALFSNPQGKPVPGLALGAGSHGALVGFNARFVARLSPTGTALDFASSLGFQTGGAAAFAVDRAGSVYLAGATGPTGLPTTSGAFSPCSAHPHANVGGSIFVVKLAASGTTLSYVTCLPGAAQEFAGMAVDPLGHAYITGTTYAADAPTTANAAQPQAGGGTSNVFLVKLNLRGTALTYGTYLGRRGDNGAKDLAVDEQGNAYITGYTGFYNLPTTDGAAQPNFTGSYHDGFVMRVVLPKPQLPALIPLSPPSPALGVQYFPATHHTIRGPFLTFWRRLGGVTAFGLPRSETFDEDGQTVQYFERARMILIGTRISLTPLGSLLTAGHRFESAPAVLPPGARYFPATGHTLSGPFLRFWQQHQGASVLGLPISEPVQLQAGDHTAQTHLMQYLQNARLEYHPEFAGTVGEVTLGCWGRSICSGAACCSAARCPLLGAKDGSRSRHSGTCTPRLSLTTTQR